MRDRVETLGAHGPREQAFSVVICDAEPVFARGLARLLETAGPEFQILGIVTSSSDLEEIAREMQPDLAILDGRFGLQPPRGIRVISPRSRVVLVVGDDQEADVVEALRAGVGGCLVRQSEPDEIVEALRLVLRDHVVVHAAIAQAGLAFSDSSESTLTNAERQILAGIARGETNSEIAARLHLSERTIRRRVVALYSKFQLADRIQAALYAVSRGLSTSDLAGRPGLPRLASRDFTGETGAGKDEGQRWPKVSDEP